MACCTMPAVPGITEVGWVYNGTCKNIPTSSANFCFLFGQKCNMNRNKNGNLGSRQHTGAEPSKFALARAKGSDPATKELALWNVFVKARSLAGHLWREESVVATHSHSSPWRANLSTGCSSLQSNVLSLVAKSVRYTCTGRPILSTWIQPTNSLQQQLKHTLQKTSLTVDYKDFRVDK